MKNSDIVTDNFRPGTMQRFGFDHESLSEINPRIITLSGTAYGYTGPWRRAGSRARTVDAACGLSYLTGYEGGPSIRASNNYMDHSVGNNVAFALLLALYQRRKTGKGMRIDLTMQETGVSAIGPAIPGSPAGHRSSPAGLRAPVEISPQRLPLPGRGPLDCHRGIHRPGVAGATGMYGKSGLGGGSSV